MDKSKFDFTIPVRHNNKSIELQPVSVQQRRDEYGNFIDAFIVICEVPENFPKEDTTFTITGDIFRQIQQRNL